MDMSLLFRKLKKNLFAVSIFHFHNIHLFHYFKSFKHESLFIYFYLCPVNILCIISNAQFDIIQTYRPFSLKIIF